MCMAYRPSYTESTLYCMFLVTPCSFMSPAFSLRVTHVLFTKDVTYTRKVSATPDCGEHSYRFFSQISSKIVLDRPPPKGAKGLMTWRTVKFSYRARKFAPRHRICKVYQLFLFFFIKKNKVFIEVSSPVGAAVQYLAPQNLLTSL